jgi:hypothetical protein
MIELMNCNGIFSQDYIDDIKEHIVDYHQGFMIVNDELYLPTYKVRSLGLHYDDDTECIVLDDYNKATAKDKLSQLFNDNDYITNNELIDLSELVWTNDLEHTLDYIIDLCHANYWQGYDDGFNA